MWTFKDASSIAQTSQNAHHIDHLKKKLADHLQQHLNDDYTTTPAIDSQISRTHLRSLSLALDFPGFVSPSTCCLTCVPSFKSGHTIYSGI